MKRDRRHSKNINSKRVQVSTGNNKINDLNDNIRKINKPATKVKIFTNVDKPYGNSIRIYRPKSIFPDIKRSIIDGGSFVFIKYIVTGKVSNNSILEALIATSYFYGLKTKQNFDTYESITLIAIGENLKKNETVSIDFIIRKIINKSKLFNIRKKFNREFTMDILEKLEMRDVIELKGNYLILKEKIELRTIRL